MRGTSIRESAFSPWIFQNVILQNVISVTHMSQIPQCIRHLTMQHFVTEMCTFLLQNGAIEGYGTGALPNLYNISNRAISQIPQCIRQISHNAPYCNAPFCNRNVHTLLQNGALWDICLMHCGVFEMGLYNWYLVSTVDTDGLVLQQQGISRNSADYTPTCFHLFIWVNN